MEVVPFVSVLADATNPLSGLAGAGFAGASVALILILSIVIGIPLYFITASVPLWLAAKIAVSGDTTFGTAIKVVICHFLVAALIGTISWVVAIMAASLKMGQGVLVVLGFIYLAWFFWTLTITANAYGIAVLHAFGVHILAFLLVVVMGGLTFFGCAAMVGMAGVLNPLQASYHKIQDARSSGQLPAMPAPESSENSTPTLPAPVPVDYTTEIDGMLNAALHPAGPVPSLIEREDAVRSLQQKLQAQRANLQSGDSRAATVYQNQLNRYMLLLEQVKAERKAHPMVSAPANAEAAR